jgi:hypothetical protein
MLQHQLLVGSGEGGGEGVEGELWGGRRGWWKSLDLEEILRG